MCVTPTRAIVPAAGYGSRLRPLTYAIPKELLPVGRKTVLDYVLEELRASGVEHVLMILSSAKKIIRDYLSDGDSRGLHIDYLYQKEMRGLGDAILKGEDWIGAQPFIVAFGDCFISSDKSPSPLNRMLNCHLDHPQASITLCEIVNTERVNQYGILDPLNSLHADERTPFQIKDIIEKPCIETAPSRYAVAARWILNQGIFIFLHSAQEDAHGEINLTDSVRNWMRSGGETWAAPLSGNENRWDIGGWESYFTAVTSMILSDAEFGERVKLKCIMNQSSLSKS